MPFPFFKGRSFLCLSSAVHLQSGFINDKILVFSRLLCHGRDVVTLRNGP